MKIMAWAAALAITGGSAMAAPQTYDIDTAHSQVLFSFDHHGFSPVTGLITGVAGVISFDAEAPTSSSVTATIPLTRLTTGHEAQDADILSPDFLGAAEVTFRSTRIEVTGTDTAFIVGDLTLNGVTQTVTLDATLNRAGLSAKGVPTLGLSATTTLLRSAFDAGRSAPANSDAVRVTLAIEATAAPEPEHTQR
nr:YceI family protein [Falsirhodobacter deserti]